MIRTSRHYCIAVMLGSTKRHEISMWSLWNKTNCLDWVTDLSSLKSRGRSVRLCTMRLKMAWTDSWDLYNSCFEWRMTRRSCRGCTRLEHFMGKYNTISGHTSDPSKWSGWLQTSCSGMCHTSRCCCRADAVMKLTRLRIVHRGTKAPAFDLGWLTW